jgi:hypothetical protein
MKTQSKQASSSKMKQLERDIAGLKAEQQSKIHLTKDAEQDYDIKSRIIDKQNQMIALFIKQRDGK